MNYENGPSVYLIIKLLFLYEILHQENAKV